MTLIKWNNTYSVSITAIDNQHKKLVEAINALHEAMLKRKTKEALVSIIDDLINYTKTHFSDEEKYFKQYQYPDSTAHINEHNIFVKKVTDFKKGFENGQLMLSMDIMNYLKEWLVKHIQGTDKKYTAFFKEKGLK